MADQLTEEERDLLQRLEEDLWREETRFDRQYMETLFAADFCEIGRSGRLYEREATLSMPKQPIDAVIPLPDFRIRVLADGVVQVIYNSHVIYDGVLQKGRRSSIWTRVAQGWMIRFHQGTGYE